jgi:enoyl-[acyl-carrier protein] reductase / trans-2-enoyl-CoA reductase (NAD+)
MDIVKPKIRGFVCVTAHPEGCAAHLKEQVDYVLAQGPIHKGPKRVLVIGSSTGYGWATRIVSAFACQADTLGVCFERPSDNGKPASAGWYNTCAFHEAAKSRGLYAKTVNGDAFSQEIKQAVVDTLKADLGPVDLVIYSLASPRRTDSKTNITYKSALKPIGKAFEAKNLDTDKKLINTVRLEPATTEEIDATIKVMGGEDWEEWMELLQKEQLLAPGAHTVAYSYIGPEVTWPIYKEGTIGKAKEDLERASQNISKNLEAIGGKSYVAINKAVVTQASSAIPVVPLYLSVLFKVMKAKGTHEGCIEQMYRLFATELYNAQSPKLDDLGRIRMDNLEMEPSIQETVSELWPHISSESIDTQTDFESYQKEFLKLFGFGLAGVDYEKPTELDLVWDQPSASKA